MRTPALCLAVSCLGACHAPPPAINRVPIAITVPGEGDEVGGMVVPVAHGGAVRYLAIDTGSALTFLYLGDDGPEYRRRAGRVRIGSESLALPGRGFSADDETEIGIVGVLGADYFCTVRTLFDPVGATITRYHDPAAIPLLEEAADVPYENIGDHVILRLRIDGRERRLMWDTGCPHLLLIGEEGRPGDEQSTGEDVEGGRFSMFHGRATLEVPGQPAREIAALRAPTFPYFEGTVEALGGGIDGLAGQSVFGRRRMLFLPDRSVVRIEGEVAGTR